MKRLFSISNSKYFSKLNLATAGSILSQIASYSCHSVKARQSPNLCTGLNLCSLTFRPAELKLLGLISLFITRVVLGEAHPYQKNNLCLTTSLQCHQQKSSNCEVQIIGLFLTIMSFESLGS